MAARDAGDAVTMLQSLAGSTFDSSQLVLIACMGYQSVDNSQLQELSAKNRPQVLAALSERSLEHSVWSSTKRSVSSKVYTNHGISNGSMRVLDGNANTVLDQGLSLSGELENGDPPISSMNGDGDCPPNGLQNGVLDEEETSTVDLVEQVKWLKVELSRALEECRAANLRADELETAFMELVKEDNRRLLCAKLETLEDEAIHLRQALADKEEQEQAMLKVMLQMEQEQRSAEDARRCAEEDAAAQRHAANVLQAKYEDAVISLAAMEKRTVMAESVLEATLQYQALDNNALLVPPKRCIDSAATHEAPSRWSWSRLSPKPVDLSPVSTRTRVDGADITNELLRTDSTETQLADPQKQGSLSRRLSLGWREKSKTKSGALETEGALSPSGHGPEN